VHRTQDVGEVEPVRQIRSVGVDVLPEQSDLPRASGDQAPRLRYDLWDGEAALGPAAKAHDAIRAMVVAPVGDRHQVGDLWTGDTLPVGTGPGPAFLRPGAHVRLETADVRRREEGIHVGEPRAQPGRVSVYIATHDDQRAVQAVVHQGAKGVQAAHGFVLSTLPHDTSVQHEDVRLFRTVRGQVAE